MKATTAAKALMASMALLQTAAAANCTIPAKTLTFDCGGTCDSHVPCWLNTTKSTTSCNLECLTDIYYYEPDSSGSGSETTGSKRENFVLLVPFGSQKSIQEQAEVARETGQSRMLNISADAQFTMINDDYLDTIQTLNLSNETTTVLLLGGSALVTNIKGHVSTVALSPTLLTNELLVNYVDLSNLDLSNYTTSLVAMLPPNVVTLTLDNTILTAFPKNIGTLKALTDLYFQSNYLTAVGSTSGMDSLLGLDVSDNSITSFTAVFPKLTALELGVNELQDVPSVLTQYSVLEDLWLYNNSITTVSTENAIPSLVYLNLTHNRISTFETHFANLSILDLSYNELKEIPSVIFSHTQLTNLSLANNRMTNVMLTAKQAIFFSELLSFDIDESSLSNDCSESKRQLVHKVYVCIAETTSSSSLPMILGIVGGVLVLVIIIVVLVIRARKIKRAKDVYTMGGGTMPTMAGSDGTSTLSLWYDVDLLAVKVTSEEIEDVKIIGKGAFGDVWLVKYRKTQLLASKRLRKSEATRPRIKNFIEEIKLVAKLEHPNIVSFVGAAWTIESDLQALFEFMDGGDLRDYLESNNSQREWTPEKVQIAIDIAEALVYVHSFSPPLVHRDLKSRNVLLSATDLQAKLTDFGVSRFRSEDNTMTSGVGTGKWLAPEVISGSTDYGPPADIFSFGAVLTELDSHQLPYHEVRGPNGTKVADVALLQMIASGQVRPSLGASCPEKIVELANQCFALDPAERPAAAEIAWALRTLKKSMVSGN
ncbi:Tkl protein kinase [Globisporangium polare]